MNLNPPAADPTDRVMKIPPVDHPKHEESLLDQAGAESFPASDPISPAMSALEPGDVRMDERFTDASTTRDSTHFSELIRRNAPALIAIGTAAAAFLVMRALRGRDGTSDDGDGQDDE